MTNSTTRFKRFDGRLVGVLAVLSVHVLAGCGSIDGQTGGSALVSPGKYDFLYTCKDIEQRIYGTRARLQELEQLMTRAQQGAGGELVNALAYRTEYLQAQGELAELTKSSADKKCVDQRKGSGAQAVF